MWWRGTTEWSYFEAKWKPKAWKTLHRFLFLRTRVKQQHKEPIQPELFVPHAYGYEFKVILTNKPVGARKALVFHNGRGSQEGIFAELKSDNALAYVPTRTWVGNQIYLLSVLLAHNLGRELQMIAYPPSRATLEKRPALWSFERLGRIADFTELNGRNGAVHRLAHLLAGTPGLSHGHFGGPELAHKAQRTAVDALLKEAAAVPRPGPRHRQRLGRQRGVATILANGSGPEPRHRRTMPR
ncbi:MAG: hypothetical protein ACREXW_08595 [Gammaproteobacteria bacterium]